MTVYGYARVSSPTQNLEEQESALIKAGAEVIYSEKASGKSVNRPKLQELLNVVQEGDTVIFTKIDRFARSTSDALNILDELNKKKVAINIVNFRNDIYGIHLNENDTMGKEMSKMIVTMLLMFAEFERNTIVERLEEGKAHARATRGSSYREGRKVTHKTDQIKHAYDLYATHSLREVAKLTGIPIGTLHRRFLQLLERGEVEPNEKVLSGKGLDYKGKPVLKEILEKKESSTVIGSVLIK